MHALQQRLWNLRCKPSIRADGSPAFNVRNGDWQLSRTHIPRNNTESTCDNRNISPSRGLDFDHIVSSQLKIVANFDPMISKP